MRKQQHQRQAWSVLPENLIGLARPVGEPLQSQKRGSSDTHSPGSKMQLWRRGWGWGRTFFVHLGALGLFVFSLLRTAKPPAISLSRLCRVLPPLQPASARSARFSARPPPRCQSEGEACSYKRAWLGDPATPGPWFQRAESWKEGRTARGAGMPREDINSAFLSGFRSSPLFSFPLFPPGRVRREPALQRENFPGACVEGCSLLLFPPVWLTPEVVIIFDKKMISLKEDHLSSPEPLVDEAVGVKTGWGGWQPKKPGPFQKNGRDTSAGQGQAAAFCWPGQLSSSSFVLHPSAPHSCGRADGGPELQRKGEGRKKIANSIVGSQPYGAG